MNKIGVVGLAAGFAGIVIALSGGFVRGADHGDSPQVRNDTRADINDVYLFRSPETPANAVMIMTVCPLAGATGPKLYAPKTKYEFAVDTDGDASEDKVYSFTFSEPDATGHQKFVMSGPNKLKVKGETGTPTTFPDGGKVVCDIFDDPFFFDLIGFKRGLAFAPQTSRNFFNGLNTMAIVLEMPASTLGPSALGVWARTVKGKKQIDRMGRPAINTALITSAHKDVFNSGHPREDKSSFAAEMTGILKAAPFGRSDTDAAALTSFLLPDILTVDFGQPLGFPNGRQLSDDVIDVELGLLSNNVVTTDFVANDNVLRNTFPYLGTPNP
jgi:hypothetical protein